MGRWGEVVIGEAGKAWMVSDGWSEVRWGRHGGDGHVLVRMVLDRQAGRGSVRFGVVGLGRRGTGGRVQFGRGQVRQARSGTA